MAVNACTLRGGGSSSFNPPLHSPPPPAPAAVVAPSSPAGPAGHAWSLLSRGRMPALGAPACWSGDLPLDQSGRSPAGCGTPQQSRVGSRWR